MTAKRALSWSLLLASLVVAEAASATSIALLPSNPSVALGNTLQIAITADIDTPDAIIGFGFDVGTGPNGILNFVGFTPGPLFADDPFALAPLSDGDGIRGASGGDLLLGPAISGSNVLLGTLTFLATSTGTVTVGLGADDLNFFYTEGLIPEDPGLTNFLPTVAGSDITVAVNGVPAPSEITLIGLGLAILGATARSRHRS